MIDKPIWDDLEFKNFDSQCGNIHCKTLIVGGGLCGLLTAFELIEQGYEARDITIIDAARIFSGSSVRATAKLTSQHGVIYEKITRCFGLEQAQQYATANQNAVKKAQNIAQMLDVCEAIENKTALLYAVNQEQAEMLNKEYIASRACHITCKVGKTNELPFDVECMLAFADQAAIHPKMFAKAIVNYITEKGCTIYENTTALAIQDSAVFTDKGKIFAEKIVISTRFPFVDKRGLYFIKLHQQRSYLLAIKGAKKINGMYLGLGNDAYTFRQIGEQLIFGGGICRNGMGKYSHFFELAGKSAELFEGCEITHRWSNEDVVTNDGIPYIGTNKHIPNTYIATGFGLWGMSSSFVAAKIISSQIIHGYADNSDVFSPSRSQLKAGKKNFVINTMETAAEFASVLDTHKHKKRGASLSKGSDGRSTLHAPLCTHMKCPLRWNKEEHCWDCPCHGSRFNENGQVVSGPAVKRLDFQGNFKNSNTVNKV